MDVIDRAHTLTSVLQNAVGATATDETWSQIANYLEQVKPQVDGLRRHLGRSRALGSPPSLPHLQRVRSALDCVRDTLNTEPDQLGQSEVAEALRTALKDAVIEHRDRANEEWSGMRDAVIGDFPEGLLRLYMAVPNAREAAKKASTLRASIVSATAAPAEIEHLVALKQTVDVLRQVLEELRAVALPAEVERFLDNALRGDALWTHLTADVMEWLKGHDMLTALRLKIV